MPPPTLDGLGHLGVEEVVSEGFDRARALWQDVTIAPATLVRSIARKLGADSEDQPSKKVSNHLVSISIKCCYNIYNVINK